MRKKYFGLRIFKTGLAVALCIASAGVLHLDSVFFAAIAAHITMGKTVGGSFKIGKNRVIGTIIGALLGMIFAFILPGNAILTGVAIMLLIILCNKLGISSAISVGGIVLIANMVNLKGKHPFVYSMNRIYDTSIGIIIALIINILIVPHNSETKVRISRDILVHELKSAIEGFQNYTLIVEMTALKNAVVDLEKNIQVYMAEIHPKIKKEKLHLLEVELKDLKPILMHMEILETLLKSKKQEPAVYDYHLKEALSLYNRFELEKIED